MKGFDLNQEKREELIREHKQALKDNTPNDEWVDQYSKFIEKLSGHLESKKELIDGHLPDCRKFTGHSCNCIIKQLEAKYGTH